MIAARSITEQLDGYKAEFEAGNKKALLNAVSVCLNSDVQIPKWVAVSWNCCLLRYETRQVLSLDEVFGISRPEGEHHDGLRKKYLSSLIWQRVVKRKRPGLGIGHELWAEVAEELTLEGANDENSLFAGLKISAYAVRTAYTEFKPKPKSKKGAGE